MSSGGAIGFASATGGAMTVLTEAQKIAAKVFLMTSSVNSADAPIDEAYEVELDDFAAAECALEVAADAADYDAVPTPIVPMDSSGAATVVAAIAASRKVPKFKAPRASSGAPAARKAALPARKPRFKRPRSAAPQGGAAAKASAGVSPTTAQLVHRTSRAAIVPSAVACTAQVAASRTLLSAEQAALVAKKRAAALAKLAAKRSAREHASSIALAEASSTAGGGVPSPVGGASPAAAAAAASSCAPRSTAAAFAATEFIATGIVGLDARLGGGLPIGQLTEVHGASGCGKTQLFYTLAGAVTRAEGEGAGRVLWIDCLRGYAQKRLEEIPGASLDAVLIAQVNTLAHIRRLIKFDIPRLRTASAADVATPVRLVMLDGLVAAVSAAEELETASYSRRAAVVGEILALLRAMAAQQGCAAIVTCEVRANVVEDGARGGGALHKAVFETQLAAHCSARLYIRKAKSVVRVAAPSDEEDEDEAEKDAAQEGSGAGASAAKKRRKAAPREAHERRYIECITIAGKAVPRKAVLSTTVAVTTEGVVDW